LSSEVQQEIPRRVASAVLPVRTREALLTSIRRESVGIGCGLFFLLVMVWTSGGRAWPWLISGGSVLILVPVAASAVRRLQLGFALHWLDRNQAWESLAALPPTRSERWNQRLTEAPTLFWTILAFEVLVLAGVLWYALR
jgi:hypothetical protein